MATIACAYGSIRTDRRGPAGTGSSLSRSHPRTALPAGRADCPVGAGDRGHLDPSIVGQLSGPPPVPGKLAVCRRDVKPQTCSTRLPAAPEEAFGRVITLREHP